MNDENQPRKGKKWLWLGLPVLVLLVALGSVPLWAGGLAAGVVEKGFAADRAGRLELGELDLSWTGRQSARGVSLYDDEDKLVAEVSLDLPSLLSLVRGRGKRIGEVLITASADLVADDEGISNLERALAARGGGGEVEGEGSSGGGGDDGDGGGAGELDLFIGLTCPRLTWSDVHTRALGAPFELTDVTGKVILRPGEPVLVALDGAMSGSGTLHVRADLRGILDGGEPEGEIEAEVVGMPSGLVDALAGLDGLLVPSLGETFDVRARADGGLADGRVSIDLKGTQGGLSFLGQLQDGVLRAFGPDEGLDLRCADPSVVLARYVQPSLPEGGAFTAQGLVLSLREFGLPIPAGEFDQAAFLEQVSATFGLTLDRGSLALPDIPGGPLDISDVLFSAQVEPEQPFLLTLSSGLPPTTAGAAPGSVNVRVDVLGLEALLPGAAAEAVESGWSAQFSGTAKGLETARVDALFGQEGLLVDAIGPSSSVSFSGVWPPTEEPMKLELDSPGATLAFTGVIQDGVLVASGEQSLAATLPLSPLLSKRIIGPLVPMMVQLQKPAGVSPLGLSVTDFRLPLDGDLSGLDATVSLELGEVAFELVPGLSDVLAHFGGKNTTQTTSLNPFSLRIEQGIARYDGLPLRIEGYDVLFKGAFDLAKREFDFEADVPLAVFGQGVARELDKVRKYLDPGLAIPVELSGSWSKPKVGVGKSFLDKTVKEAAGGAVKKGLFDLLDKELGGDN